MSSTPASPFAPSTRKRQEHTYGLSIFSVCLDWGGSASNGLSFCIPNIRPLIFGPRHRTLCTPSARHVQYFRSLFTRYLIHISSALNTLLLPHLDPHLFVWARLIRSTRQLAGDSSRIGKAPQSSSGAHTMYIASNQRDRRASQG
jgi:hypothetical protein